MPDQVRHDGLTDFMGRRYIKVIVDSGRFSQKLFRCGFYDVVGIEAYALGDPSDGRIHPEQVGHFDRALESARGPSEGEVGAGMKDLLSGLKDLQCVPDPNPG